MAVWLKSCAYYLAIVREILIPPTSEAMRPRKCLLPNTRPSNSPNSLSKHHLALFLFLAFQPIWILAALQWGFSRIGQALNNDGTWTYFQDMEIQSQIAIASFYLCTTRWRPCFLSGIAKHLPLAQAKQRLVRAVPFLPIHDLHAPILTPSILDFALITTFLARFCIPQSISLFTSPCRPFTSPFPQCQDLLHAPPTYVMTFWIVVFLLLTIAVVLDWIESGLPIYPRHFIRWHAFSTSTSTPSLLPLLLRCFLGFICLNLAFGDPDPGPLYWAIKPALFSPTAPLEGWFFSISIATALAICASMLRWAIVKLGAFSFLRVFGLLHNRSVSLLTEIYDVPYLPIKSLPNYYEVGLSSLRKAYPTTSRARSQPGDHPEKISKNGPRAYRCKRSPLTPQTFEPLFSLDAPCSLNILYEAANPVDLAALSATQLETIDAGNVDGASLTVADSACSASDLLLELGSITPPPKGGMYLDEEDRFPRMRPTSRLGFNAEEASSRWGSSRAFDGDSEMEGSAAMLFRPSLQPGEFPQLRASLWSRQLDLPLTPAHDAAPRSPSGTPSNHSSISPLPSTPEVSSPSEDDCGDSDEFPLSPVRVSYDWARAATFFGDSIEKEGEVEEVENQRVFHLAQIPDLHTIEEETSDEEMEMDREL